jgi:sensor histidine kinase regulating citrate/malate metabolism
LIIFKSFLQRITHFFQGKEAELTQGHQDLAMIMAHVHEAIITFSVAGHILSINNAAKSMFLIDAFNRSTL